MRALDVTTKTGTKDLLMKQASGSDTMRDLAHDLMNQLTVVDLCVFQLRTVSPPAIADASAADLARIARVIEEALHTAKRLSLEINSLTGKIGAQSDSTSSVPPTKSTENRLND
jgi:hypothetical protein